MNDLTYRSPWMRWLGIGVVSLAGVTLGAATARAATQRSSTPPLSPDGGAEAQNGKAPLTTDVDAAMPSRADFPMGWDVEDDGRDMGPGYNVAYRVLRLRAPSDKCEPQPCTYILVISGIRRTPSMSTTGWGAFINRDRAYAELNRVVGQYAAV